MADTFREATLRALLERQLTELLHKADLYGYVVTVENEPVPPLAMGRHRMVPTIRPKLSVIRARDEAAARAKKARGG